MIMSSTTEDLFMRLLRSTLCIFRFFERTETDIDEAVCNRFTTQYTLLHVQCIIFLVEYSCWKREFG